MNIFLTILAWILFGVSTAYIARQRGRDPIVWFAVGMLLGVFGLLLVFLMPAVAENTGEDSSEIQITPLSVTKVSDHIPENYRDKQWFYLSNEGGQAGPMTIVEIKSAWLNGLINKDSFVWCEGMPDWIKAGELTIWKE